MKNKIKFFIIVWRNNRIIDFYKTKEKATIAINKFTCTDYKMCEVDGEIVSEVLSSRANFWEKQI